MTNEERDIFLELKAALEESAKTVRLAASPEVSYKAITEIAQTTERMALMVREMSDSLPVAISQDYSEAISDLADYAEAIDELAGEILLQKAAALNPRLRP